MDPHPNTSETISVAPGGEPSGAHGTGIIDVSGSLVLWTWVTFVVVSLVLYKKAWKPILAALDKREEDIRTSVEQAEKIRAEMERLEETRQEALRQANDSARALIDRGRKAAQEAARIVERKAKEETQIMLENATREIRAAQEKAQAALRRESAELAVGLAARIIKEKLDKDKERELTDRLINEI